MRGGTCEVEIAWKGGGDVMKFEQKLECAKGVLELEFIHGKSNLEKKIELQNVYDKEIGISYCAIIPAWLTFCRLIHLYSFLPSERSRCFDTKRFHGHRSLM